MLKNKNIILTSLGGAAIAAGVWYYFTKRNISVVQRYEKLFQSYEKEFFLSPSMPLTTQIKFDQLFDLAVYDENDKTMIYNRLQYQGEDITNQGKCTNAISIGSVFYDCYDCSPIRQDLAKTHILAESQQVYLVICEDCFDVSKHRGHKFEKMIEEAESKFKCFCGDSNLMEEQSFCCSHQGFDKTREIAIKQKLEKPILWKGIEKFLLDSFYMVFNRMSDLLMKKNSGQSLNNKDNDQIARLNIYFSQIVAKINEIIELNPPSIHNIAQIFQLKLQRPISLQELKKNEQFNKYNEQWIPVFSDKKKINNDISVYEYILIFYQFINDSNDTLLNKLFSTMNTVNESFNLFLIENFTKYISFTIRENKISHKSDQFSTNDKALPSFTTLLIVYGTLQKVFDHLIDSLGEDIFSPFDVLIKYLEVKPKISCEIDYLVFFLFNITLSPFYFFNYLKKLLERFPFQTIDRFNILSYTLFQTNSFKIKYLQNSQQLLDLQEIKKNLDSMFSLNQLEVLTMSSFFNMISALLLIKDEKLIQTIVSHLCNTFQKDVLKAREFIDSHQDTEFKTFSLFFLTKLPILIALSERQLFSKETVNSFFSKNFTFNENKINEKETKSYFLTSLQTILNTYLYNLKKSYNVLEIYDQASFSNSRIGQDLNVLLDQQTEWAISANSKMSEFYMLTSSLLLLIDDAEYQNNKPPCKLILQDCEKYIDNIIKEKNPEEILSKSTACLKQLQQEIFDPIPMMNIFGSFSDFYFPKLNSLEDTSKQNHDSSQFASNIKHHMITVYQLVNEEINDDNELRYHINQSLDQPSIINKYINEVFLTKEIESVEGNKQQLLVLKPEYVNKFYFRSFLKYYNLQIREYLAIAESKCSDRKYSQIELDLNFNDLFQYQIDLYKKIYLNYEFQVKLKELSYNENSYMYMISAYQHVFQTLLLIKQKDNLNLFSNDELSAISNIIPLYQDDTYFTIYQTKTKELNNYLNFIKDTQRQLIQEKKEKEENQAKQQQLEQQLQQE